MIKDLYNTVHKTSRILKGRQVKDEAAVGSEARDSLNWLSSLIVLCRLSLGYSFALWNSNCGTLDPVLSCSLRGEPARSKPSGRGRNGGKPEVICNLTKGSSGLNGGETSHKGRFESRYSCTGFLDVAGSWFSSASAAASSRFSSSSFVLDTDDASADTGLRCSIGTGPRPGSGSCSSSGSCFGSG